ncbi:MAG: hypothetical protein ACI87O_001446 [Planctomycetota bacterium]|jgi:hypothetical protein
MPHLKALVERHKDDPFVLLGVNTNDDEDAYREGVKKYGVSWTCAYQAKGRTPISRLFEVTGYPTYYLIGPDGKILGKGHDGSAYDKTIQKEIDKLKSSAQ